MTAPDRRPLRANRDARDSRAEARTAAAMINLDTVALLQSSATFRFRGLRYTVRRLPWYDGIQLEFIRNEVTRIMLLPTTREHFEVLVVLFEKGFNIMWRWARPRGWWWRGRWRNPFSAGTYAEFTQLASFFSECQMLLPDLALGTTPGSLRWTPPKNLRKTWQMVWRSLSRRSPRGAWTGAPSVMSIIGSGSDGLK